jgi:hypothetical protein
MANGKSAAKIAEEIADELAAFDAEQKRLDNCEFVFPDELANFFERLAGIMRDALSPHATYWHDPPTMGTQRFSEYIARRNRIDKSIAILIALSREHGGDTAEFRWFRRLIHGEVTRDNDKARSLIDATSDLHHAIFGKDWHYFPVWDAEQSPELAPISVAAESSGGCVKPKEYLFGWGDILDAVGMKNTPEDRGKVQRLNDNYQGPIMTKGQGSQPRAEKTKLVAWWDGLEGQWEKSAQKQSDRDATVKATHNFGREGIVAPEIKGSVKRRRGSASPNISKGHETS